MPWCVCALRSRKTHTSTKLALAGVQELAQEELSRLQAVAVAPDPSAATEQATSSPRLTGAEFSTPQACPSLGPAFLSVLSSHEGVLKPQHAYACSPQSTFAPTASSHSW